MTTGCESPEDEAAKVRKPFLPDNRPAFAPLNQTPRKTNVVPLSERKIAERQSETKVSSSSSFSTSTSFVPQPASPCFAPAVSSRKLPSLGELSTATEGVDSSKEFDLGELSAQLAEVSAKSLNWAAFQELIEVSALSAVSELSKELVEASTLSIIGDLSEEMRQVSAQAVVGELRKNSWTLTELQSPASSPKI